MKTFILKISAVVCVVLFMMTALFNTSCNKDKKTHGKVTVNDTAGRPIASATVKLSSPPSVPPSAAHPNGGDLVYSGVTDGAGVANFEIPLPGIWDIKATSTNFPGMNGKGILRLDEPSKSTEVIVVIKP